MAERRREFHFVFGLRPQTEPFHVLHYLCLASCAEVNQPAAINLYYRHEPFGPWWERIRPRLTLHRVTGRPSGYVPERYGDTQIGQLIEKAGLDYAHEADFLRLDVLLAHGGVYADMDTLFVRRYPDAWWELEFAIGEEDALPEPGELLRPSLCNAVIFSQPGVAFARAWRERMPAAFDGTWNSHSCREAGRLWQAMPHRLRVLPRPYFYRYGSTATGLRAQLEESNRDHDDLYSVHLWAHLWWSERRKDLSSVYAGLIDERWIRREHCTLARLARPFLDA